MKKTYKSPTMFVVKIEQHLLDGHSLPKDSETPPINDNNAVLGRGGSDWDDED